MNKFYFTSESVTEGHPDKICDYISDLILDEYLKQDRDSRVAVETFASKDKITIAGQVTSRGQVNIEKVARTALKDIGYDDSKTGIDYRTCDIDINITKQSEDIARGVDTGGAGDQGIMFGYACKETQNYMPYAINTAHMLAKELTKLRKEKILPYLKPDGKTEVIVEYEKNIPKRIESILISAQHNEDVKIEELREDIKDKLIKKVVPRDMIDENTKIFINPTGKFVIGGPLRRYRAYRKKNYCRYIWRIC